MNLVQQSGDFELMGILQGLENANTFNPHNLFNITVLIPQQPFIQQLGVSQELSMVNKNNITLS